MANVSCGNMSNYEGDKTYAPDLAATNYQWNEHYATMDDFPQNHTPGGIARYHHPHLARGAFLRPRSLIIRVYYVIDRLTHPLSPTPVAISTAVTLAVGWQMNDENGVRHQTVRKLQEKANTYKISNVVSFGLE